MQLKGKDRASVLGPRSATKRVSRAMTSLTPISANILIAAEKPASAAALDGLLRGSGYRNVRISSDGREVVPLHTHWPFELLILDMHMHTISSLDVLAALMGRIDTGRLKVVALLDEQNAWLENQSRALGVCETICGALERDVVLGAVGAALKYRSQVA